MICSGPSGGVCCYLSSLLIRSSTGRCFFHEFCVSPQSPNALRTAVSTMSVAAAPGEVADPAVNRRCAIALKELGQFDQAIACWHRVELLRPKDEEAAKQIGNLQVERTIDHGGYEDAESSTDVATDK